MKWKQSKEEGAYTKRKNDYNENVVKQKTKTTCLALYTS